MNFNFPPIGILILWTSDDCPQGHWVHRKLPMDPEDSVPVEKSANIAYSTAVSNTNETEKAEKGVVNVAFTSGDEKGINERYICFIVKVLVTLVCIVTHMHMQVLSSLYIQYTRILQN